MRLLLCLTTFTVFLLLGASLPAVAAPPNILVIVGDDVGWGDLGSYGGKAAIATPALDRLAEEGMRFTSFYSQQKCSPTRASLLTGRYSERLGIDDALAAGSTRGLAPSEVTIAEMLAPLYPGRPLVGKWHLGERPEFSPLAQGFLYFQGLLGPQTDYNPKPGQDWWVNRTRTPMPAYSTTALTTAALDRITMNDNLNRPFFLYLPWQAAHAPFSLPGDPPGTNDITKRAGVIRLMDAGIGRIMDKVRTLRRPTFVFFQSDNGWVGAANGGLRGGKSDLFEGGIRVPAIAWWPGMVPAHSTSAEPLHSIDVLPTIAALTGVTPPPNLDGRSFAPLFAGGTLPPRPIFWSFLDKGTDAVRDGRWKMVRDGAGTHLFDLQVDLGEKVDVAGAHPDVVQDLTAKLEAWRADVY